MIWSPNALLRVRLCLFGQKVVIPFLELKVIFVSRKIDTSNTVYICLGFGTISNCTACSKFMQLEIFIKFRVLEEMLNYAFGRVDLGPQIHPDTSAVPHSPSLV